MRFLDFKNKIPQNLFSFLDLLKIFAEENPSTIKTQLSRWNKKGWITKINRGLYCFDYSKIDELLLANILFPNSYLSAETVLHYYGLWPDIPFSVTSATAAAPKKIINKAGSFFYFKIKPELFFGYQSLKMETGEFLKIALPEKALLDYIYLKKIKSLKDLRLDLQKIDRRRYARYAKFFPLWVQRIKI